MLLCILSLAWSLPSHQLTEEMITPAQKSAAINPNNQPTLMTGFAGSGELGLFEELAKFLSPHSDNFAPLDGWMTSHLSNQACNIGLQLVNRHNFTR